MCVCVCVCVCVCEMLFFFVAELFSGILSQPTSQGCTQKILGAFQWFKSHKAGDLGAQPPDALEFIHSQTTFIAIFCVS